MQAQTIARMARELGSDTVAHGCTAAGNDQVRFEVALRTLAPDLEMLAPVRDRAFKRAEELEYLQTARAAACRRTGAAYSVNRGLWGVTIGGTGDAHLRGQHSRGAPGCSRATPSASRARPSGTRSASSRGAR